MTTRSVPIATGHAPVNGIETAVMYRGRSEMPELTAQLIGEFLDPR